MTNTDMLLDFIRKSGKKKSYLAEKCGLSRAGFRNCLVNKAEWRQSHIDVLCRELGITDLRTKDAIFFAKVGA